jgi:predicted unusual protein kinase regulating ubiquinone biosynthesis (AarF/ABC1/UbiB family)
MHKSDTQRRAMALLGLNAILKMIFQDNFIHAGAIAQFGTY